MKKIDLKSKELDVPGNKKDRTSNSSVFLGVLILLLVFGFYGYLVHTTNKIKDRIKKGEKEILSLQSKLDTWEEIADVYDFQKRLFDIEEISTDKVSLYDILENVEAKTLKDVNFEKFVGKIEEKGLLKIEATITTADHYVISKQLESYSTIKGASKIRLDSSKREGNLMVAKISFFIDVTKNIEAEEKEEENTTEEDTSENQEGNENNLTIDENNATGELGNPDQTTTTNNPSENNQTTINAGN